MIHLLLCSRTYHRSLSVKGIGVDWGFWVIFAYLSARFQIIFSTKRAFVIFHQPIHHAKNKQQKTFCKIQKAQIEMKCTNAIAHQTINNVNLPVQMISMMASLITSTPANSIVYFVDFQTNCASLWWVQCFALVHRVCGKSPIWTPACKFINIYIFL